MKKCRSLFFAFILGQLVQLGLHACGLSFFPKEQLTLCASAGLLIALALFAGAGIASREKPVITEELAPPSIIDAHWTRPLEQWRLYENQSN